MRQFRVFFAVCVVVLTVGALVIVWQRSETSRIDDGRVHIAASFYPLAEFARQVGGDAVTVETLTPAGVEPHDVEPTPRQVAGALDADLLLVNGGIDAWAVGLIPAAEARGAATLAMSEVVGGLLPAIADEHDEEDGDAEVFDPHFWLSPVHAQRAVTAILDTLVEIDEDRAEQYRTNATAYLGTLAALDHAYADGLAQCERRVVVASHASPAYLAAAYDFELLPIAGRSPDAEPSAGALATLARVARSRGVRHIFFETLASPALAETLAREIGAQTLVFNPLEGLTDAEIAAGESYVSIMQENLANLRTAMACP
ncbi:MAG: zinc ABC transporter substrate-binding protein [bacterium]|nr:zinc ABC transporter substrate-binding protein [bacterium]